MGEMAQGPPGPRMIDRCFQCKRFVEIAYEDTPSGPICNICIRTLDGHQHWSHQDMTAFLDRGAKTMPCEKCGRQIRERFDMHKGICWEKCKFHVDQELQYVTSGGCAPGVWVKRDHSR